MYSARVLRLPNRASTTRLPLFACPAASLPLHYRLSSTSSNTSENKSRSDSPNYLSYGFVAVASATVGCLISTQMGTEPTPQSKYGNFGSPKDYERAIVELQTTFAGRKDVISTDENDLSIHGYSSHDYHHPGKFKPFPLSPLAQLHVELPHSVVAYPESTEDVVKIVKIATKYRMPITPYSGATSLEGHTRGVRFLC